MWTFTVGFTLFQDPSGFMHQHLAPSVRIDTKSCVGYSTRPAYSTGQGYSTGPGHSIGLAYSTGPAYSTGSNGVRPYTNEWGQTRHGSPLGGNYGYAATGDNWSIRPSSPPR
ncbi:hypothetical protein DVH24_028003 [Malus domestica]|uniref:Uncharacterized protein n=1 Tax=Malus domestica TaxID=3750 RepID=A0A498H8Y7_MALDO|nr:hypothetical protein DVH24_028003 [Malus domestica]